MEHGAENFALQIFDSPDLQHRRSDEMAGFRRAALLQQPPFGSSGLYVRVDAQF